MKTKRAVVDREMTAKREEMAAYFRSIMPVVVPMTPEEKEEFERECQRRLASLDRAVEVEEVLAEFNRASASTSKS